MIKAFALTGRIAKCYSIPRVLPWARSFCPFRACGIKLAKLEFRAHLKKSILQKISY